MIYITTRRKRINPKQLIYYNCRQCGKPIAPEKRNYGYCGLTCFLIEKERSRKNEILR